MSAWHAAYCSANPHAHDDLWIALLFLGALFLLVLGMAWHDLRPKKEPKP